jgi:hypothetical protein
LVNRLQAKGTLSPEAFVDACLDLIGPLEVGEDTRQELMEQAREGGALHWDAADAEQRVAEMLQLIVAMREYQFN